ncbi:MAG TPA: FAD-linked oxidase C-terminal domain-containing protein [Candidatus Levybacteria bacterium]|nr:FAD-linked oxidase C-terminal domain-containing protein [Candidatus Levybacteria bacterium]
MSNLLDDLKQQWNGEIRSDEETLKKHSRDASIFEITPEVVVVPKDSEEIQSLVSFVNTNKKEYPNTSLTPRAAGTDMSGGTLTNSISVSMEQFTTIPEVGKDYAVTQPGVFYRNFEREILKHDLMYPPYTSSRNLCTVGGMVANNSAGEKSLQYGKAKDFVLELKAVLSDGKEYHFKKLSKNELEKKIAQNDFEGKLYKKIWKLLDKNKDVIHKSRPTVSKDSTGYNIWDTWDGEHFDMTKLLTGSQGTLGIVTEIKFRVLPEIHKKGLLVIYMRNYDSLPEIVQTVLKHKPASFESFDHHTMRLGLKYYYGFAKSVHTDFLGATKAYVPELWNVAKNGMPKMVLLVEYEDENLHTIHEKIKTLKKELSVFSNVYTKVTHNKNERDKYWALRRESFNLLRQRVKGMNAAPFIDDTCVDPKVLPEMFPKLYKILDDSKLLYTIAGHIGDGNFHIIPLMNLSKKEERDKIYEVADKVFDLVLSYGGSISGEHNDGIVRSPYLKKVYGETVYTIFKDIKEAFDPLTIFNPHKKIGVTKEYAEKNMISSTEVKFIKDYK